MKIKLTEEIAGHKNTFKGEIQRTPKKDQKFVIDLYGMPTATLVPHTDVVTGDDLFEFTTVNGIFYKVEIIDDNIESIW